MNRTDIINHLAKKIDASTYLEIGVNNGSNFNKVNIAHKVGVDPDETSKATEYKTSDDFFKDNKEKFDIIFVDGLHHNEQCFKDITNSLKVLNKGGYIVCHDMKPMNEAAQKVPREQRMWNGDVWKAWVNLRQTRDDLEMFVVDTDHGCGVIRTGKQELLTINIAISYENLVKERLDWLDLKSIEDFKLKLCPIK